MYMLQPYERCADQYRHIFDFIAEWETYHAYLISHSCSEQINVKMAVNCAEFWCNIAFVS